MRGAGERPVLTLTDGLIEALAQSNADRLATVAVPWSQTEEFWGEENSEELTSLLQELSGLARDARNRGEAVHRWVSVHWPKAITAEANTTPPRQV